MRFEDVTDIPMDAIELAQTVRPGGAAIILLAGATLFWGLIATLLI